MSALPGTNARGCWAGGGGGGEGGGGVVGSVALKHVLPDPLKGQYTFTSLPSENKRPYFMAPASFSMQN